LICRDEPVFAPFGVERDVPFRDRDPAAIIRLLRRRHTDSITLFVLRCARRRREGRFTPVIQPERILRPRAPATLLGVSERRTQRTLHPVVGPDVCPSHCLDAAAVHDELRRSWSPSAGRPAGRPRRRPPAGRRTARATTRPGASASIRSTGTCTGSGRASASSSGVLLREAATTRAASSRHVRVTARPIPLDAPVTTATRPESCRSTTVSLRLPVSGRPVRRYRRQAGGGAGLRRRSDVYFRCFPGGRPLSRVPSARVSPARLRGRRARPAPGGCGRRTAAVPAWRRCCWCAC